MSPSTTDPKQSVHLERTVDAPIDVMWDMWTVPEHFAAWYGPAGATASVSEMDVAVGGRRLVSIEMSTPNGPMTMWFTGTHTEVRRPHRLVYTEAPCDETGAPLPPEQMGMPPGDPIDTEVVVELTEADRGTHIVLRHIGVPGDSPGAMGWSMALDKLVAQVGAA